MKKYLLILLSPLLLIACRAQAPVTNTTVDVSDKVYCSADHGLIQIKPIQSHHSYCVVSNSKDLTWSASKPYTYAFWIIDDQGEIVKDFDVVHEQEVHLIVARKDLASFQHLHPQFNKESGVFVIPNLVFPNDGPYHIYTDFTPSGQPIGPDGQKLNVVATDDINVGDQNKYVAQAFAISPASITIDGYQITLTNDLQKLSNLYGSSESLPQT